MLKRIRYASMLALVLASAAAIAAPPEVAIAKAMQPPEVAPAPKAKGDLFVQLPDGEKMRLVNREKMRLPKEAKKFSLAGSAAQEALKNVKPAPASFDFTKTKGGASIKFPVYGNNRYGDCFYVAPVHLTQSQVSVRTGVQLEFSEAAIIKRYLQLSPRDNGLSNDDILPEWRAGIVGPNGPYKLIDYATIDPKDTASIKTAMYYLGGMVTTHSLRTTWMSNIRNGMIWTNDGRIDPDAGHAVAEHAVNAAGNFITSTWGYLVELTPAGLANSDAEVLICVTKDWFDAKGYTPNGDHYIDIAKVWEAGTGRKLPVGLFPDPEVGPPPPPPPPVSSGSVVVDPATKTVTIPDGWTVKGGNVPAPVTPGTATSPAVEFVKNHAAKKQARKDGAGLLVSKAELAAARAKIDAAVSDSDVENLLKEKGAKVGGPLTDLLEWITTHQAQLEALVELILKLVSLFADVASPPAWVEVSFVLAM